VFGCGGGEREVWISEGVSEWEMVMSVLRTAAA